jgi:hypothetical protein
MNLDPDSALMTDFTKPGRSLSVPDDISTVLAIVNKKGEREERCQVSLQISWCENGHIGQGHNPCPDS